MSLHEATETVRARTEVYLASPPGQLTAVLTEAEHRCRHMTERAAYQSVLDDLLKGRWTP